MSHAAVLTVATERDGSLYRYVDDATAEYAIERFGHAVSVERQEDGAGVRYLVMCTTQRGDTGAFRMHSIACAYGIPVHVA